MYCINNVSSVLICICTINRGNNIDLLKVKINPRFGEFFIIISPVDIFLKLPCLLDLQTNQLL